VSGTVGIAGTLTYEDVTNIDSVGIITAQKDIHVGAGLSVVGVSTLTGAVNSSANITTTLDLNSRYLYVKDIFMEDVSPELRFVDTDNDPNYRIRLNSGLLGIRDITNNVDKLVFNTSGMVATGIVTATTFSGSGASLTNLPLSNTDVQVLYTLTANGSSAYRFAGNGIVSTEDNPDVYLIRGLKYRFVNNSGGSHPFQIRQSSGGSAYSAGVTNNGAASGNIDFQVPYSAPSHLYYQCTSHGGMVGNLYIRGAGGQNDNVGVTTFSGAVNVTGSITADDLRTDNSQTFYLTTANDFRFRHTGGSERLRIDSSGNFNLGLSSTPLNSSTEQGVYLAGADSTQSVISSNVTPFVVNRMGTGGNDRNCIEFRNDGSLKGTVGAVGVNNGIFFQSGVTEVMRITSDYKVLVGLTTTTTTTSNNNLELAGTKMLKVGNMYIGYVIGTGNNDNGVLILHKMGQSVGLQFSGMLTIHSYTGSAYLSGCIVVRYNTDAVTRELTLQKAQSGANFELVSGTISGESGTYFGIKKNGGGTGSFYINAFVGGNIEAYGGIREVSNSNWTTSTTHFTVT